MEVAFLNTSFNLPNYTNELQNAASAILKLKEEIFLINLNKNIDDRSHEIMFERIVKVLDYVGNLSQPSFEIEDELEKIYIMNYSHSPELAKKLWQDHYESIHHPFDLLKNRCFRLIEELDAIYHSLNKKHPKNWKP